MRGHGKDGMSWQQSRSWVRRGLWSWLSAVVTLYMSLEVVILSEPLTTHFTRVAVLALLRPVQHLVYPQLVLPSEPLAAGGTFKGGLASVRHLMVPQELQSVVLDRTVSALVAVDVQVFLHHVSFELGTTFESCIT